VHTTCESVPDIRQLDCYDIVGDTLATTQGSLLAAADKAKSCSPSILLLQHVEALARKSESTAMGKQPPIVKVLEELLGGMKKASAEVGWPCVLVGTTVDVDAVPGEVLGVFKQEIAIPVCILHCQRELRR
jgi:peroxin-6